MAILERMIQLPFIGVFDSTLMGPTLRPTD
jgi:hypothetical protein